VARRTLADLIERLTEAHEMMKSLAVERVERRIARQLLKLAQRLGVPDGAGLRLDLALSRQDLADMAGTTVETAIRVLSRWRAQGLVADRGGWLVITDPAGLSALAEEPL
jgi:CRP/FNR family transcriptional regulator